MTEAQDVITLTGLSAVGKHGVFEFERSGSQVFTADLTLWVDARRAVETDDVQYTVNYAEIADAAVEILTGPPVYLIETLAHLLTKMALRNPLVQKVAVTIHKPMAPVGHLFEDVSVTLVRDRSQVTPEPVLPQKRVPSQVPPQLAQVMDQPPVAPAKGSSRLILALGSNQGDSVRILSAAVGALIEAPGIEVDDVSPLVVSTPVLAQGQAPQPNYYNAVVLARTVLEPQEVLQLTQSIEAQFGRIRAEKWGPRTLDIDLIDFGGRQVNTPELTLPHPRAHSRAFVLYPWALADPDAKLGGASVAQLARQAADYPGLKSSTEDWLLEERPAPVEPPKQQPTSPRITVRGNPLALVPVSGDSLFQQMLEKENRRQAVTPPRSAPTRRKQVQRAAATKPAAPAPVRTPKPAAKPVAPTQPKVAAPRTPLPSRRAASTPPPPPPPRFPKRQQPAPKPAEQPLPPTKAANDMPELPSWRFLQGRGDVRIVDSVDDGTQPATEPGTENRAKWNRRKVIRPTPTGMIALNQTTEETGGSNGA